MRSVLHKGGVVTLQTDCVDDAGGHGAHGSCMDDARGVDCSGRVGVGSTHGRAGGRLLASIKKRKSFSVGIIGEIFRAERNREEQVFGGVQQ